MHFVNVYNLPLHPAHESTPDRFAVDIANLSMQFGAQRSGVFVTELQPGQAHAPYHYELTLDKWMLVLAGSPSVRTAEGRQALTAGDIVFLPPGPEGGLQVENDTDESVRLLFMADVTFPCVTMYPESGKIAVWTEDGTEDLMIFDRGATVDYFHGES